MHSAVTSEQDARVVPRASDPRPARTRAAVIAAVERLAAQEGATMTIGSIAAEAGVSRSALYGQFADLDALLATLLIDTSSRIGAADVAARRTGEPAAELARRSLSALVEHVETHRVFYVASLGWRVSRHVYDDVLRSYAAQIRETIAVIRETSVDGRSARIPDGAAADDAASYIAGGLIALLTAWIRSGLDTPADVVVDRLIAQMPGWLVGEHPASP